MSQHITKEDRELIDFLNKYAAEQTVEYEVEMGEAVMENLWQKFMKFVNKI